MKHAVVALALTLFGLSFQASAAADERELTTKAEQIYSILAQLKAATDPAEKRTLLSEACELGNEVAGYDKASQSQVISQLKGMGVKNPVGLYKQYCK